MDVNDEHDGGVTTAPQVAGAPAGATSATPSAAERYAGGALGFDVPSELNRLRVRERLLDPDTRTVLTALPVQPGWRCLEVGAGTGSIAVWLAQHCPDGTVLAADVDTRHLHTHDGGNLEVRRHDVVTEDFPAASFDLIHARSVLANLPERDQVLPRMAGWLAPGGWLVIEDPCAFTLDSSPYPAHRRLMEAFERYMAHSHGADIRWPRTLPARLAATGLTEIGMRLHPQYVGDGGPGEDIWRVALAQARPGILAAGLITAAEFDHGLALFDDPAFLDLSLAMISVWGRAPIGGSDD